MKVVRTSEVGYEEAADQAARALANGGIVLYPTDTLYGLAVDATNPEALQRLFMLKERDPHKPVSVVVPDVHALYEHARLGEAQAVFAHTHLPGPLTLVLPGRANLPSAVMHNGAVGLRVPNDPFVRALAHVYDAPYTATSANKSGEQTKADPLDVVVSLGSKAELVDLVIDDGPRDAGTPSTVVLYVNERPLILRPGVLSAEELGIA